MNNKPAYDRAGTSQWRERPEGGALWGLKLAAWIALKLGRNAISKLMYPVAGYFLLTRGAERQASRQYLSMVFGRPAGLRQTFHHFVTFARVAADRVYFLTGRTAHITVAFPEIGKVRALVQRGRGGVILAAHFGSFEAARVIGENDTGVSIRMVLDRAVGRKFIHTLETLDSRFAETIIDPGQSSAALGLKIAEALSDGKWVGFLADRHLPGDRTVACEFLGRPARFPIGPFIVAAAFKAPLICLIPIYIDGRYELRFKILSEEFSLPRQQREDRVQAAVQQYADYLAGYVREYPYNWFNFFDFWGSP